MGEAAKPILFEGVKSGCNVVLRVPLRHVASFSEEVFMADAALWRPPSVF